MTIKEEAKNIIDHLPNESSMEDIIHALYIREMIDKGEQEIRDGKGIPQEDAIKRIQDWQK